MTHWWSQSNYGQILQAYALKQQLNKMGFDSYIIKFDIFNALKEEHKRKRIKSIFNINAWIRLFSTSKHTSQKVSVVDRDFDWFKKKYLDFSSEVYTNHKDLNRYPPKADIYIVGSDQVWLHPTLMNPYLLDFGHKVRKRIAYAASFGRSSLTKSESKYLPKLLRNFTSIGVREESGLDLIRSLGYDNSRLVPDPTLFLNKKEWLEIKTSSNYWLNEGYKIFVYMIGKEDNTKIHKASYQINKDQNTIYVGADGNDTKINAHPTIPEWIDLISTSDFVITNSFHGTVFCLIFNKNFISFNRDGASSKMNVRISSLLSTVGLGDRLLTEYNEEHVRCLQDMKIEWDEVNAKIELFKNIGVDFLQSSLF